MCLLILFVDLLFNEGIELGDGKLEFLILIWFN